MCCCGCEFCRSHTMRKAEATAVTALLRLLWRTRNFTLSFDDRSTFSRPMSCTTVVREVSTCISEPNSVARWEKEEERGQAGRRDFQSFASEPKSQHPRIWTLQVWGKYDHSRFTHPLLVSHNLCRVDSVQAASVGVLCRCTVYCVLCTADGRGK